MKLICKFKCKAVITAVIITCIIVCRQNYNKRLYFSVLYSIVYYIFEIMRISIRSHKRCLITPAAVTQVKYVVFILSIITIRKINPRFFCYFLRFLLITEWFPCIIRKFLKSSLFPCRIFIAIRYIFQFIRNCPAQINFLHICYIFPVFSHSCIIRNIIIYRLCACCKTKHKYGGGN